MNQKLAVRILEKYGHEVTVAQNGLEALEEVKKHHYDVVLMDVQMPIMGGFEATQKIRMWEKQINPNDPFSVRVPIIALTAHAMLGDREKCMQAQMDEYISKPLKPNLLIQTIAKTIHHVSKLKELASINPHNKHLNEEMPNYHTGHNSSSNSLANFNSNNNPPKNFINNNSNNNNSSSSNSSPHNSLTHQKRSCSVDGAAYKHKSKQSDGGDQETDCSVAPRPSISSFHALTEGRIETLKSYRIDD